MKHTTEILFVIFKQLTNPKGVFMHYTNKECSDKFVQDSNN